MLNIFSEGVFYVRITWIWNLHAGNDDTSAVTVELIPKLAKLPRTKPHVNATYCNKNVKKKMIKLII